MKVIINKLSDEKKLLINPFISYDHKSRNNKDEIEKYFNAVSDDLIEAGEDFNKKITLLLSNSTCVIVTGNITPWVAYEIGLARALNKPIYAYKAEDSLLLLEATKIDNLEDLWNECKKNKLYMDIFTEESESLSINEYQKNVINEIDLVDVKITIPEISTVFSGISINFLIPQIIRNEVEKLDDDFCLSNLEDISNKKCPYFKNVICPNLEMSFNKMEGIILNKSYKIHEIEGDTISFMLPVHKRLGMTFKIFIDVIDLTLHEKVEKILKASSISFSSSGSGTRDRIFIELPEDNKTHLFKYGYFNNNFICPGIFKD